MEPELSAGDAVSNDTAGATLTLAMPAELLAALDTYAADATGHPDRSTLLLRIVRDWLVTNGYLRSDPTGAIEGADA